VETNLTLAVKLLLVASPFVVWFVVWSAIEFFPEATAKVFHLLVAAATIVAFVILSPRWLEIIVFVTVVLLFGVACYFGRRVPSIDFEL